MGYTICCVLFFVVILLIFVWLPYLVNKENKRKSFVEYTDRSERATIRGLNSASIKKVRESIDEVSSAYADAKSVDPKLSDYFHRDDLSELKDHLHSLEEEKWQRKADKHLERFAEYFETITSEEFHNFKDADLLFKTKKKCIDEWQRYFAIDLSEYETTIYPKKYMKEWFGEEYEPCMDNHAALEARLSACVQRMRPEYDRKKKLYKILVDYVNQRQSVKRSELLKKRFEGYTAEEVRACYRELIKTNRLFEMKMDNCFFVSLSDKERSKRKRQNKEPVREEITKQIPAKDSMLSDNSKIKDVEASATADEVISLLQSMNIEFVDKTAKGGHIYFFDKDVADTLKNKGFKVFYAKNGTKGTGGRPAWYV